MDQKVLLTQRKIEVYLDRSRKAIVDWLNAYIISEDRQYPRRRELIDVYEYAYLDNHLRAVWDNRKDNVIGEKWQLVDQFGEPLEDETKLLKKSWFRRFLSLSLDARPFGYSLIELQDDGKEVTGVKLIERRNTHPERREVLVRPSDLYGYSIDDPAYRDNYILVDGEEGLGLLLTLAPDVIYKRYAKAAWVEHAEKFSLPFIHAKTSLSDSAKVTQLEERLAAAGREFMMLTDHGDEINVIPPGSTDAYKIYDTLVERVNSEISKRVAGQTMTVDNGSSRSQSEVHERVGDKKAKNDRDFITDLVNDELLPRLVNLGYPLEGCRFEFPMTREQSTDEKIKVFDLILRHYKVSPEQIKAVFGVDVEEKEQPDALASSGGFGKEDDQEGK